MVCWMRLEKESAEQRYLNPWQRLEQMGLWVAKALLRSSGSQWRLERQMLEAVETTPRNVDGQGYE